MKHYHNRWYYRGRAYATFHEALEAAWPRKECRHAG